MAKVITLGIAETWKDNYGVVAYCQDTQRYLNLDIPVKDINNWDIFSVTEADLDPENSQLQTIESPGKIVEQWSWSKGRDFLREKAIKASLFYGKKYWNSVIAVDRIEKINFPEYDSDGMLRSRLDYSSAGKIYNNLLCKDWRWVNYWSQTRADDYESKIEHWFKYLNEHEVYLIYHKHRFHNGGTSVWIQGIHCF